MIKILYTIPNFITAGSGQALLHVVKRLDRNLFEPSIAVLKTGGALEQEIEALGIPLLELPFTVPPRPLTKLPIRIIQSAKLFRPYEFDIWHSYHYSDDYTEPLIARMAGAKAWVYTKKNMGWGSRAWWIRSRLASRIPSQNTTMMSRFFNTPSFSKKAQLVPPGVDTAYYRPQVLAELAVRQKYNIDSHIPLIGCIAHLVEVKDHPNLIKALAKVPEAHLILAGKLLDREYVQRLEALIKDLELMDRVHFLGNVENIPALHAELDMFVLPTMGRLRMEGCPVALLEAMACETPAIATDIPGPNDVIIPNHSGLLVPPENPDSLADAINSLIANPEHRKKMGINGRQRVLDGYTIQHEVQTLEAIYNELIIRQ
ncbi:MAG: glycosyltransferase [Anaerolineales bacterium]|nr:glycosyltransferase [Anaerolineales bacterium]